MSEINHTEILQDSIKQKLLDINAKLELELREKQNIVDISSKQRHAIGVELYSKQMHLNDINTKLMSVQKDMQVVKLNRQQNEALKLENMGKLEIQQKKYFDSHSLVVEKEKELATKSEELGLLEFSKEELLKYIANNTEEFSKSAKEFSKFQSEKIAQDYYLNGIVERKDNLLFKIQKSRNEKQELIEKIKLIKHHLRNSEQELQLVDMEKKQVIVYWNSALKELEGNQQLIYEKEADYQKYTESLQLLGQESRKLGLNKITAQKGIEEHLRVYNKLLKDCGIKDITLESVLSNKTELTEGINKLNNSMLVEQSAVKEEQLKLDKQQKLVQLLLIDNKTLTSQLNKAKMDFLDTHDKQNINKSEYSTAVKELNALKTKVEELKFEEIKFDSKINAILVKKSDLEIKSNTLKSELVLLETKTMETSDKYSQLQHLENENLKTTQKQLLAIDEINKKILYNTKTVEDTSIINLKLNKVKQDIYDNKQHYAKNEQEWAKNEQQLLLILSEKQDKSAELDSVLHRVYMTEKRITITDMEYNTLLCKIKQKSIKKDKLLHIMNTINYQLYSSSIDQQKQLEKNQKLSDKYESMILDIKIDLNSKTSRVYDLEVLKNENLSELERIDQDVAFWQMKTENLRKKLMDVQPCHDLKKIEVEIHRMDLDLQRINKLQHVAIEEMNCLVEKRYSPLKRLKRLLILI